MDKNYFVYEDKFIEEPKLKAVFENEKDAEEYCMLYNLYFGRNKYYFTENVKYESLNDYAKNNNNRYIEMLENAIIAIENRLYRIQDNQEVFKIELNRNKYRVHNAPLYVIKSIVDNGAEKLNRTIYQDGKEIKLSSTDYPIYVKEYRKILKEIANYKKLIKKYKKQLKMLTVEHNLENIKFEDKTL